MTTDAPTPEYVHATPDRVMSTLAYRMLARHRWPVYVYTARNYEFHPADPTDPGDTISASGHLSRVDPYHPFAYDGAEWPEIARYLDDRITADDETAYDDDAREVTGPRDEYFILVESPDGGSLATYGDYVGSCVERSNHRSLLRDFPDVFVEISYGYGGYALAIPLFVPAEGVARAYGPLNGEPGSGWTYNLDTPHYALDRAEDLADILDHLAYDYPLYDEEDHSELERELAEQAIGDPWRQQEIRVAVADELADLVLAARYPVLPRDEDDGITQPCTRHCRDESSRRPPYGKGRDHVNCANSTYAQDRAIAAGVDVYDLIQAYSDFLSDADNLPDLYEDGAGGFDVYELFLRNSEQNCRIQYETGGTVGLTESELTYAELADHLYEAGVVDDIPVPMFPAEEE